MVYFLCDNKAKGPVGLLQKNLICETFFSSSPTAFPNKRLERKETVVLLRIHNNTGTLNVLNI